MLFESDTPTPGSGGKVTLWAGGEQIGSGEIARTVPIAFTSYTGMDIGREVHRVVFDLQPADHEAEKALHEHVAVQAVGQGAAG